MLPPSLPLTGPRGNLEILYTEKRLQEERCSVPCSWLPSEWWGGTQGRCCGCESPLAGAEIWGSPGITTGQQDESRPCYYFWPLLWRRAVSGCCPDPKSHLYPLKMPGKSSYQGSLSRGWVLNCTVQTETALTWAELKVLSLEGLQCWKLRCWSI